MRQRVLSTLNVAHGLDLVLRAVSADQGGSELDEITEAWTVENESSGGFGAALPARDGDWLAVGMLVASKPTWPASWSVGVIRRLSTDTTGRRAVGVQILARGGVAVELSPMPVTGQARPLLGVLLPDRRADAHRRRSHAGAAAREHLLERVLRLAGSRPQLRRHPAAHRSTAATISTPSRSRSSPPDKRCCSGTGARGARRC